LLYDVINETYIADDDWADHFTESSDNNDSRRHRRYSTRHSLQYRVYDATPPTGL